MGGLRVRGSSEVSTPVLKILTKQSPPTSKIHKIFFELELQRGVLGFVIPKKEGRADQRETAIRNNSNFPNRAIVNLTSSQTKQQF